MRAKQRMTLHRGGILRHRPHSLQIKTKAYHALPPHQLLPAFP
jgi:hypothetical protein